MKRIVMTIAAVALATVGALAQYTPECKAAIEKIAAANEKFTTVNCPFTQTKHLVMMENELVNKGNLTYTRPNALKMEYTSPAGDLLEVDGCVVSAVPLSSMLRIRCNNLHRRTESPEVTANWFRTCFALPWQ